ncbi:MAG: hypothetical protein V7782_03410 [Psychromonas sp.]
MYYSMVFAAVILFCAPAYGEITQEEFCEKQGEVSQEASKMRIAGSDRDKTISALLEKYDHPGSGVTAHNIDGLVRVAYVAKLEPETMRDYVISECKKDIIN